MHYTALPILALAASASALSAGWNVTRTYYDQSQQVVAYNLTAVFVSDAYPEGLFSTCSWVQKGILSGGMKCTPESFSVEPLGAGILKIQQTIEKPTEQVVYGQGKVPDKGDAVIPVSAGVA